MRLKQSFGVTHINPGTTLVLSELKYVLDYSRKFYAFDIIPMGAVRMSSSDRWKTNPHHIDPDKRQREVVTRYFAYKDILRAQAQQMNYELGEHLDIVFFCPMPDSWSDNKKNKMNGLPCKVKPDTDNMVKAIKDTLRKQDSDIWYEKAQKHWAYRGSILIYK